MPAHPPCHKATNKLHPRERHFNKGSPLRQDVKIARGTHLMHLEEGRLALHRETIAFLAGGDAAPQPAATKEKEQCSQ